MNLFNAVGYSRAEAARRLDISPPSLGLWIPESESNDKAREAGQPTGKELKAEVQCLRAENKLLEIEREILKKAAAFFAKESN